MASKSVEDNWYTKKDGKTVPTASHGKGSRWRARYRDLAGKEHARRFPRKADAQRWLDEVTTSVVTGMYVDPQAGQTTFEEYAEQWREVQVHRPTTQNHYELVLRRYAYPTFGARTLSSILPSDVQGWIKRLETGDSRTKQRPLAPATIAVAHSIVSGVFRAAIRDRRIIGNPCDGSKLPKRQTVRVVPLTTEQVHALHDAMPAAFKAMVTLAVGTGMRQGECYGLSVDRVDFLRRAVTVDRQLIKVTGRAPFFGPPKTAASVRSIPLPQVVVDALAAHLAEHGTGPDGLLFTLDDLPVRRASFFQRIWRPALKACGLPSDTHYHSMRHYYASLLIRHGESVKTVQARLGHASATETLDTYSHLWPDSDDRTREAVDAVLLADDLRTMATRKP
jgi:integrase